MAFANPGIRCAEKFLWRLGHNTARPDILAANKAQPVDPLFVGQTNATCQIFHRAPGSKPLNYLS
jgi:hypothetical protein